MTDYKFVNHAIYIPVSYDSVDVNYTPRICFKELIDLGHSSVFDKIRTINI